MIRLAKLATLGLIATSTAAYAAAPAAFEAACCAIMMCSGLPCCN